MLTLPRIHITGLFRMDLWQKVSSASWVLLAGIMGAIVGLVVHTEIRTFRQRVCFLIGGVTSAFYLSEPVGHYLELSDERSLACIGFLIGVFGMSLLQRVKETLNSLDIGAIVAARWNDLVGAFKRGR